MYRFVETIQLNEGVFKRLPYHQTRLENAMKQFFPNENVIILIECLLNSDYPTKGLFKCRVVYDAEIRLIEFIPYVRREIRTLRVVNSDIESLPYKPEDRTGYNSAFAQRGNCDDVIIVRNGLLTDSSYSNIAMFDGKTWFTPRIPLIYGTNRAELLAKGKLVEKDIVVDDLKNYAKIALFNAMIEFGEIILTSDKIL